MVDKARIHAASKQNEEVINYCLRTKDGIVFCFMQLNMCYTKWFDNEDFLNCWKCRLKSFHELCTRTEGWTYSWEIPSEMKVIIVDTVRFQKKTQKGSDDIHI